MLSLEGIKFINRKSEAAKLARANIRFNTGSEGHAKGAEKGFASQANHGWVTAEEWDRKIARRNARRAARA